MMNEYGPGGTIAPNTFAAFMIHTTQDPYPTPWGNTRSSFYGLTGTPTTVFDGVVKDVGAITNNAQMYSWYMSDFTTRRAVPTDVTIELGAAQVTGQTYRVSAQICLEAGAPQRTMRIYMVCGLDNFPTWPVDQRNCVREGVTISPNITLNANECQLVEQNFTFDGTAWSNQSNIQIIVWAQVPNASYPAGVHQAAVMTWPFPPPPVGDYDPPEPNPMTFEAPPAPLSTTEITMTATDARDDTPPVEYQFYFLSGGTGGTTSGFSQNRIYVDDGLQANTVYTYQVRARDSADPRNYTIYSAQASAATYMESPTGLTFGTVTETSIDVTADGSFSNPAYGQSGIYFEMTPADGTGANQWVQTPSISVTGLTPGTLYTFRVKCRNAYGVEPPSPWVGPFTQSTSGGATCALTGDVNGDTVVDGLDMSGYVRARLGLPAEPGENQDCADYGTGTLSGDTALFVADLLAP